MKKHFYFLTTKYWMERGKDSIFLLTEMSALHSDHWRKFWKTAEKAYRTEAETRTPELSREIWTMAKGYTEITLHPQVPTTSQFTPTELNWIHSTPADIKINTSLNQLILHNYFFTTYHRVTLSLTCPDISLRK